ncbi:MAG: SDR family oxidoreductase [Caulobacter sp.]|nr:SDR family oxidoreductase [Caulobacter sp.]MDP1964265.1 SDR family oxidoreductase [Reyranella sp.]
MQTVHRAVYPSLAGASVFVTGGASGIGAEIVRAFADQAARVAFVDIDAQAGEALARGLADAPGGAPLFRACDLRDIDALREAMAEAGRTNGDIAVLVNNAANDTRHALADLTVEAWDDRLAVNLRPMVFAAQAAAAQMRRRGGGSIINFGSISWKTATAGMVGYTTAKAAVHGLTRSLARELGPDHIRVNTLTPGWVMTERQKALWVDAAAEAQIDQMQCLPGRLQPADIAAMTLFLAADDSRFCSAQDFTVDGGWA